MELDDLLKGVQTVAIICNQWGDTGKGKFSDYFASQWADVTARRTGWTDVVVAKYAVGINGPLLVLTKPDSLSGAKEFKLAYSYKKDDQLVDTFSRSEEFLRSVTPQYKSYEGYGDINDIRSYDKLPSSLRQAIRDFESFTGSRVAIVSVGADRKEIIIR